MDYKGIRYEKENFIYHSPTDTDGEPVCSTCGHQIECSPTSLTGRMINISFGFVTPYRHGRPSDGKEI